MRSQSALEYLLIYGFALLVIIIVGVAFYQLGVFSPTMPKTTKGSPEFAILDFKVTGDKLTLVLAPRGIDVIIYSINVTGAANGTWIGNLRLPQDEKHVFNITLSKNLTSGTGYKLDVRISYQNLFTTINHTYTVLLIGTAEKSTLIANASPTVTTWYYNFLDFRRPINITENSGNNLSDFQVAINVTHDSDMQLDFDDLRFTWYNSTSGSEVEIPYWIEEKEDGSWAYVWIKVPYIPANDNTTVYMYYGNASVTNASNGNAVFEFFDDFETLNTSVWTGNLADAVVSNSTLNISVSWRGLMTTTYNITDGVVETKWYGTSGARGDMKARMDWVGGTSTLNYPSQNSYDINYRIPNSDQRLRLWNGGVLTTLNNSSYTYTPNTWYIAYIAVVGNRIMARATQDAPLLTAVDSTYVEGHIGLGTDSLDTDGVDYILYDWIRVRKYADPEPTYVIGSEETR